MRMGYSLNVVQTQKLIMTPELRQAIAVLQLSSLELDTYIQQQIQENPLLEIKDDDTGSEQTVKADEVGETETTSNNDATQKEQDNQEVEYDIDWPEYFNDSSDLGLPRTSVNREKNEFSFEQVLTRAPSLLEHLQFQLHLAPCSRWHYQIADYIIGNLDRNGYLNYSVDDIANQLNATNDDVQTALEVVQSLDPPGVGARTLQECLLLQIKYLGIKNDLMKNIIAEHIADLADGKYNRLAQIFGVPVTEIQAVADLIKTLEPKPGRNFSGDDENRYIYPDVMLQKIDQEYVIIVNDVSVPRLTINNTYRAVLNQQDGDNKTKKYVESKLNAATWLIKSIEQRRMTLYKVTECLVDLQRDFLDYGVKYLKPLNLKTVADLVDLHESTVSRATSNKYIQTPQGVFEMKYFFSSGLAAAGGRIVSAESTKKILQEIIAGEDPQNPLNDQQVADIFASRGTSISRRTVAKYRDELGILPFRKRKRYQ